MDRRICQGLSIGTDAVAMASLQCCTQVLFNEEQHKVSIAQTGAGSYLTSLGVQAEQICVCLSI